MTSKMRYEQRHPPNHLFSSEPDPLSLTNADRIVLDIGLRGSRAPPLSSFSCKLSCFLWQRSRSLRVPPNICSLRRHEELHPLFAWFQVEAICTAEPPFVFPLGPCCRSYTIIRIHTIMAHTGNALCRLFEPTSTSLGTPNHLR